MVPELVEVARGTDYPLEAFVFLQRGLEFTVQRIHGDAGSPTDVPASRHVSGRQLCDGLRQFAIAEYGLLARTVLRRWHINCCADFGHMVFAMVEAGLLAKTDQDSIEDFRGAYEFDEAFDQGLTLK